MVYVAVACPLAILIPDIDDFHHYNGNLGQVLPGYRLSFFVLLPGGCVQLAFKLKRDAMITLLFAAAACLIDGHPWFHL